MNLTAGAQREVLAFSVFSGVVFLMVQDKFDGFTWLPAWLFEVVDASMPRDWIVGAFQDNPVLVVGPRFVAESVASYDKMVELDPDSVWKMMERIEELKSDLCPACGFTLGFPAWRGGAASDELCPCCGIQFGCDDLAGENAEARAKIYDRWRSEWVEQGMPWRSQGTPRPLAWDPQEQLRRLRGLE